ncbi:MAG: tRNA (N6-isopentenyl adenosine(37)-C2)-methylthiotransferase MiaB [Deltaproteobacteria bacterium HGW-Deltaproteobacteria-17]|nr:MAG: tRNA (N6-isopentenyl adenosine(37)-C2)-methylthiotransferase MiaB [Deltaproteobacteria bacterium HGW-Deltaproteobacteria-17]
MRFAIRTFGCQMNVYDSDRIRDILMAAGMDPAGTGDAIPGDVEACCDVFILNTCSVREKPRQKVVSAISRARAANPGVTVVVTGCVAQLEPETLVGIGADVVVGPDHYAELPELLGLNLERGTETVPRRTDVVRITGADEVPSFLMASPETMSERGAVSCFVPIQKGCDNWCAFCVVPAARGREVTRPEHEILEECRRFLDAGARELFLLGQNVNSVRLPGGFPGLLEQVAALPGLLRVRFTTSHPRDCSPELARAMARLPRVMPWLHLPVQSGSSRILAAMGRRYTREHYLELIDLFRREVPGIAFTTDVIVGFPGETEDDFEDTVDLVQKVGFEGMYSFMYSPRPGTRAATLPDPVPQEVAASRLSRLQGLHEAQVPRLLERYRDLAVEVLVEGPSARDPRHASGRNPQNVVVNFEVAEGVEVASLRGRVVSVLILEVRTHTLFGRMIASEKA